MEVPLPEQRISFVLQKHWLSICDVQAICHLLRVFLLLLVQPNFLFALLACWQVRELELCEIDLNSDVAVLRRKLVPIWAVCML